MFPEENGFSAKRQFYLLEKGQQFFYSAAPPEQAKVITRYAANRTIIRYEFPDALEVGRTLFVLPAERGLPSGVEAQLIRIMNHGKRPRQLEIIMIGMFGFLCPGALHADVLYTCVTVEPGICSGTDSVPLFIVPRYTAAWDTEDRPIHLSQVVRENGILIYAKEFCLDYRRFIERRTLGQPELVAVLDNRYPPEGSAFLH